MTSYTIPSETGLDAKLAANAASDRARANHTGTQTADTITDGTTNKAFLAAERTKLAGVATGATANRADAATDTLLAAKADLVGGLVPSAQIPAIALTNAVTVASQAAMLALTTTQVQPGDVAVRTDGAGTFILAATDPTILGNWVRLNAPTDAVTTVNGQAGTVVLAATDVGAAPASLSSTVATNTTNIATNTTALTGKAPLLTPTATKTTAYTVASGELAMMNVAGGATTLTLPAAPADKTQVGYRAIGATSAVPLIVNRGGADTIGTTGATTASIPLDSEIAVLQYDAPNTRWLGVSNVKTQVSLDARYLLHDSSTIDLNAAPFSLKPGDDATTALQTAINTIAASGKSGTIRFSQVGTYTINGALQTGTYTAAGTDNYTWNGQIVFPYTPFSSSVAQAITIEGPMTTTTGNQNTGLPNGLILQTNATAGYVFDMIPGQEYAGLSSTGIMPIFKNIIGRTPDNQTCGFFNVSRAQRAHFQGITSYPTSFTNPTGSLPFITMPAVNSNGDCTLRDIYITRWTTAINLSEHCVLDNVLIAYCDTAFQVSGRGGGHRNYLQYVDIEQVNKIFRYMSGTTGAAQFWGHIDVQSSSGWKMMLVSDEAGGQNVLGRIDVGLIQAGSLGISGTANNLDVANGGRGQSAGWMTQHPYDTFGRIQGQSMNGTANGAPGYTWPSFHPWRLSSGDVNLAAGSGSSGNMKQAAGQSLTKVLVPVLDGRTGGRPRSIEATFTTPATGAFSFAVIGNRRYNNDASAWLAAKNNTLYLGMGTGFVTGTGKVTVASAVANAATVTLRLEIGYAAGLPKVLKGYVNGVLQATYTMTAAEQATIAASTTPPYSEDGVYFADSDVTSACTSFVVRDFQAPPQYLNSGSVTLVAGAATITDANITAASIVRVFRQGAGGTLGSLSVTVTAATGFTINSNSSTDTSVVYYEVASY